MLELKNIDLRFDPEAASYIKNETVQVAFAKQAGELISREGPNRYAKGDALITGSTGDRWCVSRDRFDAKYEPMPPVKRGEDGAYRNKPVPVLAKQMQEPFTIARSTGGDVLHGKPQDWLMQYAPGDYGITENARFQKVYRCKKRAISMTYRILSLIAASMIWLFIYISIENYLRCGVLPENWKDWVVSANAFVMAILFTAVGIRGKLPNVFAKFLLN